VHHPYHAKHFDPNSHQNHARDCGRPSFLFQIPFGVAIIADNKKKKNKIK
jgi:hypothetical protein